MNGFQILILTVLAGLAIATIVSAWRNWLSIGLAILLFVMWTGGAVLAIRPATATDIARLLGIGRGADLVLYCSVLLMLVGFFMVYIRIRRLRANLTELVREIAILRAEGPVGDGGGDAAGE